jgi:hypothetical protein
MTALGLAGLLAVLAAPPSDARFECVAAPRGEPSLSRQVLPSARFRARDVQVGSGRDASGRAIRLLQRTGEETAVLPDGTRLTVTLDGCETYAATYEFRLPSRLTAPSDAAGWLTLAARWLAMVEPANRDQALDLPRLRQALLARARQAPALNANGELEGVLVPGELPTLYRLKVRRAQGAVYLAVSYVAVL